MICVWYCNLKRGDISALFGGDISTDVEEQLLRRRKWDKVLVF